MWIQDEEILMEKDTMKPKKTPLHFAQQLEDFQTSRKAKEVNEIYKFDTLKEGLKQRYLTVSRRMEKLRQKSLREHFAHPGLTEEHIIQENTQTLEELVEFEQQAYDTQLAAPDNAFDIIAEIQGFRYPEAQTQHTLKQLPEASADAFAHDLDDITEHELHKELEQNEKVLQDSLKKAGRLELSRELPAKPTEPQAVSATAKKLEEPDIELRQTASLVESETLEDVEFELQQRASPAESAAQEQTTEDPLQEKKKSESSLIYFRPSPTPSKKK